MNGYKIILPFVILISFCIYNLREFIVTLLFTPDFMPMESLFFWQLTGDVFKIAGWLLAYIMLGKAMTKLYIISEILFAASFYGFTLIFTQSMGLEGVSFAYCVNYVIYFFFITLAMKRLGVI
jgi:PST family polysaccharide transporter